MITTKFEYRRKYSISAQFFLVMKLTIVLLFVSIMTTFGNVHAQRVNLDSKGMSLKAAFKEISRQTGFTFVYNEREIARSPEFKGRISNEKIDKALDILLQRNAIHYVISGRSIAINKMVTPDNSDLNHDLKIKVTIEGRVVDENGKGIPQVNIKVKNSNQIVHSDEQGNFKIDGTQINAVLIVSSVGYLSTEVATNGQSFVQINLKAVESALDEVVVVGYGTQKKVNLTGAVQSVSSVDLMRRTTATASVALQGLVPGLSAVQSSGQPGADVAAIKIRGTGSLNSSTSPLILIDGVEGDMNRIDLNTVESISVLKDAASASIYGSRASNGVILITTKRGKEGNIGIAYNGYLGLNTPTMLPESVSAVEFMEAVNVASKNANQSPTYSQDMIDLYKNGQVDNLKYYNTDWKNQVLKKSAIQQNHSVALNGGTKAMRYFASAGYYDQKGLIANNDFSRTNIRINTDSEIRSWLKTGLDINIRQSHARRPVMETADNIIGYGLTLNPLLSGRNSDDTYGYGVNGINPIALAESGGIRNDMAPELGMRGFLEIKPLATVKVLGSYSYRKLDSELDAFVYPYDTYEGGQFKMSFPATGSSRAEERTKTITKQFNLHATYEDTFGAHYLKALGGIQSEEMNYKMIGARREGFIIEDYNEIFNGDPGKMSNSGDRYDYSLLSYLFRLNYSFADKYLLEVNGRYDGSSRFMKSNRWGFFPSVSAGWRVSEENFFKSLKSTINEFKIRGSYGLLGNQSISGYYPYTSLISSGKYYWFDKNLTSGASQTQLANENIKWEKSKQLDIGVDLSLFEHKLTLTGDYFKREITDMLQQFALPNYVGMTAPWQNAGSMQNTGWELAVNWKDQINDFKYYVGLNFSDVKNKVGDLYGNEYIGASTITKEGEAYNSYFGYVSDGYFQNQGEIDAAKSVYGGKKENVKPGFIRYKDMNDDGAIDSKDRVIIGNPSPRYEYSFTLGGEWKGFDMSLFFQGVGKRDVFYTGPGARPLFGANTTLYKHQLDYWTEDNTDADFPLLLNDTGGSGSNNIVSDFWIKSGSYLRLKNLVFGYSLPENWLKRATIQKVRLYASLQNLFTISKTLPGYDPENSISNGNYYPIMRMYNVGLSVEF